MQIKSTIAKKIQNNFPKAKKKMENKEIKKQVKNKY